jgi:hypothetical protein
MRGAFIAVVMLIVSGQAAVAQQNSYSGATLLNPCKLLVDTNSTENIFMQGVCDGIVGSAYFFLADIGFCPPQGASRAQSLRVVIQYVERNPQNQHLHLATLAERAFKEAWPCPAQPQRR